MKTASRYLHRFFLIEVISPHYHQELALENMDELEQLVQTYGGVVAGKTTQHRVSPHPGTYIGNGKLEWLQTTVKQNHIDVVVLNDIVKSGQLFRLEQALWGVNRRIAVWDRVDLILNIFEQHARTADAKLQIELARIQHIGPRVYGLGGTVLSRQGGGIGTRGLGETNIEREQRTIRRRVQEIKKQIARYSTIQQSRIHDRKHNGVQTAALIGYTSAGKTTLFNALTTKQKRTHQGLFTTLDSVVGKMKPTTGTQPLLVSDTIGFIDNLPPALIDAFRSTLMQSLEAQLILHVIDASDPKMEQKIQVVTSIMNDLGISQESILVLNKVDLLDLKQIHILREKFGSVRHFFVSATKNIGIEDLKSTLQKKNLELSGTVTNTATGKRLQE